MLFETRSSNFAKYNFSDEDVMTLKGLIMQVSLPLEAYNPTLDVPLDEDLGEGSREEDDEEDEDEEDKDKEDEDSEDEDDEAEDEGAEDEEAEDEGAEDDAENGGGDDEDEGNNGVGYEGGDTAVNDDYRMEDEVNDVASEDDEPQLYYRAAPTALSVIRECIDDEIKEYQPSRIHWKVEDIASLLNRHRREHWSKEEIIEGIADVVRDGYGVWTYQHGLLTKH